MFNCSANLEWQFSNLASSIIVFFYAKTMGVFHNSHSLTRNKRWKSFFYFWDFGDCVIIRIHTMLLFLNDKNGDKAYLWKLKRVQAWNFSWLEQVDILSSMKGSSCLLAIQHVPPPIYGDHTPLWYPLSIVFFTHV